MTDNLMRPGVLSLALRGFLITALISLMACDRAPDIDKPVPPRLVRTLHVTAQGNNIWREFPGVVEAARKADLSFRVSGELKKISVKEGDLVEKGQLLAQLDDTDYRIQFDSRKAEFDKADNDFERAGKLVDKGAISSADYDSLKAQRESARAGLASAMQNLAYTKLKAPFTGRIAVRHVENFEEVQAKQKIVTLQDPSLIMIRIDVPESVIIRVRESSNPEVFATFSQIPDQRFPLTFKEISTQSDEQTKTYAVSFVMPAVEGFNILPGMSVTVHAKPEYPRKNGHLVIHVPAHAVLEDTQGRFVYLVKSKGDGMGEVEKRLVTVGELSTLGLAVISGLEVGDQVVTAGMSKMAPGLIVRLAPDKTP
jgi:RND family efflux transporter MFP subunit